MTNHNTLSTAERTRIRNWLAVGAGIVIITIIVATVIAKVQSALSSVSATTSSTEQTEKNLTALHGQEVTTVIEQFEMRWNSLNAARDPRSQTDIVTDAYLTNFLTTYPRNLTAEPLLNVTKSITVNGVRVLEYSPQRFEVLACMTVYSEKVTREGVVVTSSPPSELRSVYVFVFQDGRWKLADALGYFREDDALRDWQYEPEWSRKLIGDFPTIIAKHCLPIS